MTRQRHNKNLNGYLQAVYQAQKCKHRSKESSYEGREKRAPMDSLSGLRRQDSGQSQRGYGPGTFPSVLPEMQTRYPDRPEGAKPTYRRARRLDAEPTTIEKSLSRCRLCFYLSSFKRSLCWHRAMYCSARSGLIPPKYSATQCGTSS